MLTMREARQRAEQYDAQIRFLRDTNEYRVTLNEWRGREVERKAYYTDCLTDAVLTCGSMRREQGKHAA